ncbi:MAG: glycosyltransferase [Candidatus Woesearchaeota archaeon]
MKIAIFSDAFYPANSGVVSYIMTTTQELSSKGHKIYLFVPYSKILSLTYKKMFNKNVKIYMYKGLKAFFYPDFKFTNIISPGDFKLFKKINPDIIFYQTPFTIGLKGIMLAKKFDKPLVGVFHTRIAHKEYISNLKRISKKINLERMAWRYLKYFYKDCDVIISPSEDIKTDLEKRKIHNNIVVINNFVDIKTLRNNKSYINVKPNSIVYLGRISVEKNLFCLIKGFIKVLDKRSDANLYIIGDGPLFKDVLEFIRKNHLDSSIHMMGKIDREIILKTDLLKKISAIVTMSNTEVQPLSLIEAMFKGLPIIGPNVDGIRELIDNNKTGILVKKNSSDDAADAILKVLNNNALQKKMSEAALIKSRNYDSKKLIKKLEQELMKIIKEHDRVKT